MYDELKRQNNIGNNAYHDVDQHIYTIPFLFSNKIYNTPSLPPKNTNNNVKSYDIPSLFQKTDNHQKNESIKDLNLKQN